MSKYLYLYRGPATPMSDFTAEQQAEQMAAWGQWIAGLGPALADVGNPFGARTSLADDGTSPAPGDLNGYSIVEADSLDGAKALADKHPFLTEGKGRFSVEVFELVPM
jgi:YCII-related domain